MQTKLKRQEIVDLAIDFLSKQEAVARAFDLNQLEISSIAWKNKGDDRKWLLILHGAVIFRSS